MSRKWLQQEGPSWTRQGIITPEQLQRILACYPEKKRAIGIIPILGSILVGLGILSFVAANWGQIPQLMRLIIIAVIMIGFYGTGEMFRRRDHDKLGAALIGLGLLTFGAGIVLTGQMFHLQAYDVTSFIVWGTIGVLLTYLIKSRYLFLLTLLIFTGLQWYNSTEFSHFSYVALAIMMLGLGYYWLKRPNTLLAWCLAASFTIQSILLVTVNDWAFSWFFIPIWLLYSLMDWAKERKSVYPFQAIPLVAAFIHNLFIVLFWNDSNDSSFLKDLSAQPLWFGLALAVLFALSVAAKYRNHRLMSSPDWLLALPFFYLAHGADAAYLIVLFAFSLYLLWRGYAEEWAVKINLGTLLFLTSTMAAYGKLAWDFMDKSIFFILGGIILLALSWFLNRRKKQFLVELHEEEEKPHE
ncbi:DUF2157 domain-containing protein [Paenibacillus lignilyticus]|uniref:DUF2157 domain-containing protein n=1 Tax=Paenibacillus lignilyticus TaxID=1172615 RepID=A0ABS5C956_9BACL|nr:DUF2157 domain-containing protein [Paenibacillus lignilyticus]MBP3962172.1 DUF2157 domain-containing protein [Paenibacillus lignilyticus]